MYVVPEYRGRGINARIIRELKDWALSQDIRELRLEVYSPNTAAIQAYKKVGFSEHMLEMRAEI
jgi:RimJ/RimL family protein N-acetyltransferase